MSWFLFLLLPKWNPTSASIPSFPTAFLLPQCRLYTQQFPGVQATMQALYRTSLIIILAVTLSCNAEETKATKRIILSLFICRLQHCFYYKGQTRFLKFLRNFESGTAELKVLSLDHLLGEVEGGLLKHLGSGHGLADHQSVATCCIGRRHHNINIIKIKWIERNACWFGSECASNKTECIMKKRPISWRYLWRFAGKWCRCRWS